MEVVLERDAVDLAEKVTSDNGEREQDRDRDHSSGGEHRECGAHHLADALALTASVGIGDEAGHARLQAEVGDAQIPGGH